MELTKLFEIQRKLDAEIEKKNPVVPGEDRSAKRTLALQVELGECANEWRGFKFWSKNQKPNTYSINPIFGTEEDGTPYQSHEETNPLLEEYVDCLHFILSIGNGMCNLNIEKAIIEPTTYVDVTGQFNEIFGTVHALTNYPELYWELFNEFVGLGEMLGFTWEEIETAYMSKNQINHERQANGY